MRTFAMLMAGAALSLALAAPPAAAQDAHTISAIEIDADVRAIGSREAAEFWRDFPADLEAVLARELFDSIAADGLTLRVEIDELSLERAFESGFAGDSARLVGQVQILDPEAERIEAVYDVSATARQAEALLPEGVDVTVISRSSAEYYDAVVDAFARGVGMAVRGDLAEVN